LFDDDSDECGDTNENPYTAPTQIKVEDIDNDKPLRESRGLKINASPNRSPSGSAKKIKLSPNRSPSGSAKKIKLSPYRSPSGGISRKSTIVMSSKPVAKEFSPKP
jgi:hypothetical protein